MESRRLPGNSHWYHETLSTGRDDTAPLVPEAARVADPFLLGASDNASPELSQVLQQDQPALLAARDLYHLLFPASLATSRLHTLTLYDRLSSALTVAQVTGIQRLCNHYAARLNPLPGPDSSKESNQRLTQITEYARLMSSQPSLLDRSALLRLEEVGLTLPDIVTFHQLIGFVNYQARAVAGLHALQGFPLRWIPGQSQSPDAPPFTAEAGQRWHPHLSAPEAHYLSEHQRAAVASWANLPLPAALLPLLAQDDAVLYGLSKLRVSLPPSTDLSQATCARVNGSRWCFQQSASAELQASLREGIAAALSQHAFSQQAQHQVQSAALLTRAPNQFSAAHLPAPAPPHLHWQWVQQVAFANWQNRLIQTLGDLAP